MLLTSSTWVPNNPEAVYKSTVTSAVAVAEPIFFTTPVTVTEPFHSTADVWDIIWKLPSSDVMVCGCVFVSAVVVDVVVVVGLVVLVAVVDVLVVLVAVVDVLAVLVTVTVLAGWVTVSVTVLADWVTVAVTVAADWVVVFVTVSVVVLHPPTTSIALSNKHTVIIQVFLNFYLPLYIHQKPELKPP